MGLRASCDPVAVSAVALASLGTALLLAAADYENTGKRLLLLPTVSPDLLDDLGGESGGESGAAGLTPLEGPALMDGGVNGGGGHIGDEDALRVGYAGRGLCGLCERNPEQTTSLFSQAPALSLFARPFFLSFVRALAS